ncbi:hypothetical protein GCM10010336_71260 [Streptomyces goshikiensis]|nr:hypothetical protein GCM10010336_71260 [Streptomyces goshikiensis]
MDAGPVRVGHAVVRVVSKAVPRCIRHDEVGRVPRQDAPPHFESPALSMPTCGPAAALGGRPTEGNKITPTRVRRVFRNLRVKCPRPAGASTLAKFTAALLK